MTTNLKSTIGSAMDRFNAGDLEGYLELYSENATLHYLPPGLPDGVAGARIFYSMVLAGFPGVQVTPVDYLTDDDQIAVRFRMRGTQSGEFMGVPASGKPIDVQGITIMRFEKDKCVERWSETNMLGLMTQIGAVPA